MENIKVRKEKNNRPKRPETKYMRQREWDHPGESGKDFIIQCF